MMDGAPYPPGGWGTPPSQGRSSDGQTTWPFTVEQLTAPGATIVFVPTLASTLDLSRLRGDLEREQERAWPASLAVESVFNDEPKPRPRILARPTSGQSTR